MNVDPSQLFLKNGQQITNVGQQQLPRQGCEIGKLTEKKHVCQELVDRINKEML